ncbi:hypothetical protein [Lysobacter sp. F6437]|uniref:hypothetical protein n=1 Tax=Lysobacter sp. F6437 TaxID=3459296 RepID=UPI00403DF65E
MKLRIASSPAFFAVMLAAFAMAACSNPAHSQGAAEPGAAASPVGEPQGVPGLPPELIGGSIAAKVAVSLYVGAEHCGASESKLEGIKQKSKDKAARHGVSSADFDAAFQAALPAARKNVAEKAAVTPADEKARACEQMLGGI